MDLNPPTERFAGLARELLNGREPELGEAALMLAAELAESPAPEALDGARQELRRLGELVARRTESIAPGDTPERVAGLISTLHGECGFHGNHADYQNPRNSFLPDVLERRTGIPITLAIVYIEVARGAGLPLRGVSFPQHFLVRAEGPRPLVLDPFFGTLLNEAECTRRLRNALGDSAELDEQALRPATVREILVRMLSNLKNVYLGSQQWVRIIDCIDRILLLAPEQIGERRDRGLIWERLECPIPAVADLERYLEEAPAAPEGRALRERIARLKPRASALH